MQRHALNYATPSRPKGFALPSLPWDTITPCVAALLGVGLIACGWASHRTVQRERAAAEASWAAMSRSRAQFPEAMVCGMAPAPHVRSLPLAPGTSVTQPAASPTKTDEPSRPAP